jgi:hypothetical protein
MGGMKDYLHRLREGGAGESSSTLYEIAQALGGEVVGSVVKAPSPGMDASDRSMTVIVNPHRPDAFFIYDCEGSLGRAKALVRDKLKLVEPLVNSSAARSDSAMKIWHDCGPAKGTLVEKYLRSRAIEVELPPTIRFHPALKHPSGIWPGMIALVTDSHDAPVAIHRTFLTPAGKKASIEPQRMALGPIKGGGVRLATGTDSLMVGEGIETCLSAMQATGRPAWSAISAIGLRALDLPDIVRQVIILVDGDEEGERASSVAWARWRRKGLRVLLARAPKGRDFNDLLMMRQQP